MKIFIPVCVQITSEDVRSLALPGSYHEKIAYLGRSLAGFTRLKHLDLSRNAIHSLEVCIALFIKHGNFFSIGLGAFTFTRDLKPVSFCCDTEKTFLSNSIWLLGIIIMYQTCKNFIDYGTILT